MALDVIVKMEAAHAAPVSSVSSIKEKAVSPGGNVECVLSNLLELDEAKMEKCKSSEPHMDHNVDNGYSSGCGGSEGISIDGFIPESPKKYQNEVSTTKSNLIMTQSKNQTPRRTTRPKRETRPSFKASQSDVAVEKECKVQKDHLGKQVVERPSNSSAKSNIVANKERSSDSRGPCAHCGISHSPQWRRGPPKKPLLCNACGTRFLRTRSLNRSDRCNSKRVRRDSSGSTEIVLNRKRIASKVVADEDGCGGSSGTDEQGTKLVEMKTSTRAKRVRIVTDPDMVLDADEEGCPTAKIADSLLWAVALALERENVKDSFNEEREISVTLQANPKDPGPQETHFGDTLKNNATDVGVEICEIVEPTRNSLHSIDNESQQVPDVLGNQENAYHGSHSKKIKINARHRKGWETTGRYIGVTCAVNRKGRTWQARIRGPGPDGRERAYVHLGMHSSPEAAARAFDRAAIVVHGLRRAVLNFPISEYEPELNRLQSISLPELAAEYRCRPHSQLRSPAKMGSTLGSATKDSDLASGTRHLQKSIKVKVTSTKPETNRFLNDINISKNQNEVLEKQTNSNWIPYSGPNIHQYVNQPQIETPDFLVQQRQQQLQFMQMYNTSMINKFPWMINAVGR